MGSGVVFFFFSNYGSKVYTVNMADVAHLLLAARGQQYPFKNAINSCAAEPCPAAVSQPLWLTEFAQVLAGARCACICVFVVVVGDKRGKRMEVSIPFDMFLRKNRSS